MDTKKIPELLAPAGSPEKLETALLYGADAVYLGAGPFSLRSRAHGFSAGDVARAVDLAHGQGKKIYAAVNIFAHNRDLAPASAFIEELAAAGVDGLIVSDPGILRLARRHAPGLPVHLSTQANVTNRESARFWEDMGVKRINLARELSLAEIAAIREAVACEIEVFVHGALCISYSGRCLLSAAMTGREANQGDCAHPCRYRYALVEEKRPGEFFAIEEDERGSYVMNSRDLCLIHRLAELCETGVDSVKIEGRTKSVYYVAAVTRCYREGLDRIAAGNLKTDDLAAELELVGTRGYTEFFANGRGKEKEKNMLRAAARLPQGSEPVAVVRDGGTRPLVETKNPFETGEEIEYLGPGFVKSRHRITAMEDSEGQGMKRANPGNLVRLKLTPPPAGEWPCGALLRRLHSS